MVTIAIIVITSLISFLAFSDRALLGRLLFNANAVYANNQWYRVFSYGLVHADFTHLLFNMFVLYSFGSNLENIYFVQFFGNNAGLVFGLLYITALPVANLYSYFKHKHDYSYNALGASGAVSAVLFSSIFISPLSSLYLMFIPFPIPSFIFGTFYLLYSWYMGRKGGGNIGHDAHFWGAIYGIVFTAVFKKELIAHFFNQIHHFKL
jgi:membrane associated rhomboid family serine protease